MDTSRAPDLPRWRHTGLLAAVLVAGLVWLASRANLFAVLDGFAYDAYERLAVSQVQDRPRVLLVELDPAKPPSGADLERLLERLVQSGARPIAFTSFPPGAGPAFYQRAAATSGVVFGRGVIRDRLDPTAVRFEPLPAAAAGLPIAWAAADVSPAEWGIHRGQCAAVLVEGQLNPTLEARLARDAGASFAPAGAEPFRFQFRGGPGSLPAVSADRVLAGGLVESLVRDQVALIGWLPPPGSPGLATPTTGAGAPFSMLDYRGHAVQALVTGRIVRKGSPLALLALLVALTMLSLVAYQWLAVGAAWRFTGWAILIVLVGTGIVFTRRQTWWPVVEIVTAQLCVFVVLLRRRAQLAEEAASAMLAHAAFSLQGRSWPSSFYVSPAHWDQVVTMVNQSLDLTRLIFLERLGTQPRLREVRAWNCTVNDIAELRRDYRRTPYLTAIESQKPLRVPRYCKACGPEEIQYLVPLLFAGDVVGFWFLSVLEGRIGSVEAFEAVCASYGQQIAELLYLRQRVLLGESRGRSALRYLVSERGEESYQHLHKSFELLEHRMLRLDGLLAGATTPTIVYDLFGRVLEANAEVLDLLRAEGLVPYEVTAVDVLAALASTDLANARRMLRHAIFEQKPLAVPVHLKSRPQSNFLVSLRALRQGGQLVARGDAAPFGVLGFVLELMDTTAVTGIRRLIGDLAIKFGAQLRADLGAIELAAPMIADADTAAEREQLVEMLLRKVESCAAITQESMAFLTTQAAEFEDHECFPIDPRRAFARARESARPQIESQEVRLAVDEPQLIGQVLASPASLDGCFQAMLTYLIRDSKQGGQVSVKAVQAGAEVTYELASSGFGMPGDKLTELLAAERMLDSHELEGLRKAAGLVRAWGGRLEAESAVGRGTRLIMHLRTFI